MYGVVNITMKKFEFMILWTFPPQDGVPLTRSPCRNKACFSNYSALYSRFYILFFRLFFTGSCWFSVCLPPRTRFRIRLFAGATQHFEFKNPFWRISMVLLWSFELQIFRFDIRNDCKCATATALYDAIQRIITPNGTTQKVRQVFDEAIDEKLVAENITELRTVNNIFRVFFSKP